MSCMVRVLSVFVITLLSMVDWASAQLSPAEGLESLEVIDGFTVELAAVEPNVLDPVAICFDENGRMYVCEMRGFQLGPGGKGADGLGRIRLLDDTDGDGHYETAHVFAEGMTYPTTVMAYAGGVLVGAAPDIIFFKDTDGDNRADVREVLYTGFGRGNHEQLLNTMQFHFDNWIYACAGGNGGDIRSTRRPNDPPVSMRRRSFRMRPFTGPFEATSGGGQYGLSCDDWGRFFVCTNSNHIIQRVLPDRYLRRNPFLPVSGVLTHISDHNPAAKITRISPMEKWRVIRTKQRAADPAFRKRLPPTELVPGGYITAACGVTVYRGGLYGPDFVNNTFVCDASNNLIHRTRLVDNGVTYSAKRTNAVDTPEFLASRNNWFRPCFLTVGPDGALYVCDMQRQIIETPASIPESIQKEIDMEGGNDLGRIYRIVPKSFKRPAPPNLGKATIEQLVAHLENPNAWYRHTAQRLLYERQDRTAVKPLLRLAAESTTPQGRLHALWTLDGLDALPEALIVQALDHPEPGLRQNAVRLAEPRLGGSASPKLIDAVLARADDDHARVRFQLAFTLGALKDPRAVDALAALAARDAESSWMRTAILSSCASTAEHLLGRVLRNGSPFRAGESKGKSSFLRALTGIVGAQQKPKPVSAIVRHAAEDGDSASRWWRDACLRGLGEGLRRGKQRTIDLPSAQSALIRLLQSPSTSVRASARQVARKVRLEPTDALRTAVKAAVETASADEKSLAERVAAVEFLGFGTFDVVGETLESTLNAQRPKEIQTAGITALGVMREADAARVMVENWLNLTPDIRAKALDAMFANHKRILMLLDGIESEAVQPWSIDPQRRDQLLKHRDAVIKKRASALFVNTGDADRLKVFESLKPLLKLTGDATRGLEVFKQRCGDCHQLAGVGHVVGPDLKGVKDRPAEQLLKDMILPSLNLTAGFIPYVVQTEQGDFITGILASETSTSVTLKQAKGEQSTILRRNIDRMYSSSVSIMPAELEKDLSHQQIADLITFLKTQP